MQEQIGNYAPQGATPMSIGRILTRARLAEYRPPADGVHWRYMAALEDSARYLGIPRRVVDLVRALFNTTQAADWSADPIAWPSNEYLMRQLSIERSQLKRLIRAARELGLVDIRESANGRRYGYRDRNGTVVEAYGFSLRPLAMRHDAFAAAAAAGKARDRQILRGRRRLTALRRELVEMSRTGAVEAPGAADWPKIAENAQGMWDRGAQVEDPTVLEGILEAMRRQLDDLVIAIDEHVKDVSKNPLGAENGPLNTPTKTPFTSSEDATGIARSAADHSVASSRAKARHLDERDGSQVPDQPAPGRRGIFRGFPVSPALCLDLAPALAGYLANPRAAKWHEVVEAAFLHRATLGISRHAWTQGCQVVGREAAAVLLAVVAMRHELGEIHASAGGLFRAMVERADDESLKLDKTLHRLLRLRTMGAG